MITALVTIILILAVSAACSSFIIFTLRELFKLDVAYEPKPMVAAFGVALLIIVMVWHP